MFRQDAQHTRDTLTIRRLDDSDAGSLRRLAQRDSARAPEGTVYAALGEDGSLLAATSLDSGELVADPFRPTAHAAKLLRTWTRELGRAERANRSRGGEAMMAAPAAC